MIRAKPNTINDSGLGRAILVRRPQPDHWRSGRPSRSQIGLSLRNYEEGNEHKDSARKRSQSAKDSPAPATNSRPDACLQYADLQFRQRLAGDFEAVEDSRERRLAK